MDIQVGDRVTYKNGFREVLNNEYAVDRNSSSTLKIIKIERPKWEVVEEKKEILTEEEREFLKLVLKFMYTEIKYIKKKINWNGELEIIFCNNEDGSGAGYCYYLKKGYFKNLEAGKGYTLKELNLE